MDHRQLTVGPEQNLPFQKVQHRVDTTDAQPANEAGGILVMVTGALMVRERHTCFHGLSGFYWKGDC